MENQQQPNHDAKFTFFYLLSLVALLFMSLSAGMIIFQLINKFVPEIGSSYSNRFSSGTLRFAISALVVSIPIFYMITGQIYKNLHQGVLRADSFIRRWLTYLILFVSSVVMIVWVIITINNFLNGELTLKFALKFLSVLAIAGTVFGFYLYDIKREKPEEGKDPVVRAFFWATLAVVIGVFISGLFIVEAPWKVKARRVDSEITSNLQTIQFRINEYFEKYEKLPVELEDMGEDERYSIKDSITDPRTGNVYEYNVLGEKRYELCADFETSNKEEDQSYPRVTLNSSWSHDAEYKCFELEVERVDSSKPRAIP